MNTLRGFVGEASRQGTEIVVFPEYNFFDLFGLIPGFALVNAVINRGAKKALAAPPPEQPVPPAALFMAVSGPLERAVRQITASLAAQYGLYIYSGSFAGAAQGCLYNEGCACTQKKLHLTDAEAEMGMSRGGALEVIALPFGRAAIPVCMDATCFDTFRIAAEKGADLILLPISDDDEYGVFKALRGIWGRVQESYVYGAKASQNGWLAGMHFTGKAGVFAPLSMTPQRDGVLAISQQPEGDSNPAFEKDYVGSTYTSERSPH